MASIELAALTSVIRKIGDITGNLIVGEVSGQYWLKEDMEWIEREMRRMEVLLSRRRVTEISVAKSTYGIPDIPDKAKSDHVDRRRSYPYFEEPNVVGLDEQNPSTLELMKDIARQVGLETEKREDDLIANLYTFLKGERYVIFLVDIWDTKTWDDLKVCLPNSDEGRSIVLTSRYSSVGRYIGGESSLHELQPLDPNSSWELFSTLIMAHEQNNRMNIPSELEDVGRLIIEKCGGVPLAIDATAGMLRRKERRRDVWVREFNKMDVNQECSNILALSYKDLPLHLKPCFLYFGSYPKGHEIPAFKIVNQWVAEGIIRHDGIQAVEDMGEDYLEELIDRNLVIVARRRINGRVKNCCIHDLLHNLCISEDTKSKSFDISNNTFSNSITEGHRTTSHLPANCKISTKRAFLHLKGDQKLEQEHFKSIDKNSRFIKVLRVECPTLPSFLPDKFINLVGLTYLELRGDGRLAVPRTISNLRSLETFDVQGCENVTLPSVIWKMQRLRHILLPVSAKFQNVSKSKNPKIEEVNLPNLQTLYALNGYSMRVKFLQEFTNLRKLGIWCSIEQIGVLLTASIPISNKMETLILHISEDDPNIASTTFSRYFSSNQNLDSDSPQLNFSVYGNLVDLYLEGSIRKLPELPTSLNKLTLAGSRLEQDPMEELGKLANLKKLQLRANSYIGSEMVISDSCFFPSLEEFILEPMPALKTLKVKGEVMPKLRCPRINCEIKLEIHSERLKNIFTEFNNYLMGMSSPSLSEIEFALPDDDFFWDEEDEDKDEDEVIQLTSNITHKANELLHEEEIVEIQNATLDGAPPSVIALYNEKTSTLLAPSAVDSFELNPGIYGTMMPFWFDNQDFTSFCLMKEITANCILLYQTYLFQKLNELSLTNKYVFIDPTIASVGSGTTEDRATELNSKLGVLVPGQLALKPLNVGMHWLLLVIDPYANTVHIFDSLNEGVHQQIKDVLDPTFKLFNADKQLNLRTTISYEIVQCPRQAGNTECGYFVLQFMRDIIYKHDIETEVIV
ncbi:Disease resistance RPP8-like protein 3 [Abeliophyllum distichum]|uniref:Disease resistance RPP8-like protein 3 n=1 Tax=Abeliophyllum distichum TaxID=126358 RepID=A0ABD1QX78_9LAMI